MSEALASQEYPDRPALLHLLFEAQVERRGNHPALECRGRTLTYAQLDRLADRYAHYVRARGLRAGALVALRLEKSVDLFAALLGILKAGAAYVPIDPKFPRERVRSIIEDGQISLVITQGSLVDDAPVPGAQSLVIDRDQAVIAAMPDTRFSAHDIAVQPEDVCYVIYTSGSTGRPKGVVIEHRNAVCFCAALPTLYGVTQDDRIYQGFSLAFDAAVEEVWAAFSIGGTLVVPADDITRSPQDAASFIAANRISFFSTVPSFLAMIADQLAGVRLLVLGGEALPAELVTRFSAGRRMFNTYGPTEATVVATMCQVKAGQTVTIGTALPHYETFVLDENMQPVAPGDEGELYIGGGAIARGYLNRRELTAEKFVANPFGTSPRLYRTHDLVRLRADREIEFLGRIDGQIKIRGFRVELSEIEAVLMEVDGIRNAAVSGVEINGFKELAAFVVLQASGDIDRGATAAHLRSKLPEYMVPKFLDVVDELPRMTSGKLDRKALPAPVRLLSAAATREIIQPRNALEQTIAEAWAKALGNSELSVTDDFFLDLGGHSLIAAHAVTAMRTALGDAQVSVRDLYAHRTIEKLAARLAAVGTAPQPRTPALNASPMSASRSVYQSVSSWERTACYVLQALSLALYYTALGLPFAVSTFTIMAIAEGEVHNAASAVRLLILSGFAVWPAYLLLGIAMKWLIVGRFKPGRIPLWTIAYWRFWVVRLFMGLSGISLLRGTPLLGLYFRAMGAKVGTGAVLFTGHCVAFDLVTIGRGASLGAETQLLGYRIEDGMLVLGRVDIGDECFVGMHCALGLDVAMARGARLDDVSLLGDGERMGPGEGRRGVPAEPAWVDVPAPRPGTTTRRRPVLYSFCHLALIYVIGYVAIFSVTPCFYLVADAMTVSVLHGIGATFAVIPLAVLIYASFVFLIKSFFGREQGGTYPLHSGEYLIHWTFDALLTGLNTVLKPVYATIYAAPMLRLFGARIGAGAEISTVQHISPDLLHVGEGSFLADACVVGGKRVHNGMIQVRPNRIGARTFIGNSALVPGGVDIGDDCLIGVQSAPPAGVARVAAGTRWLGSPSFSLPRTQTFTCFTAEQTYRPSRRAYATRAAIDLLRVLLPLTLAAASLIGFIGLLYFARRHLPLWLALASVPLSFFLLAWAALMMSAGVKNLLIGRFEPIVKPLWSKFVWLNEVVNGVYETIAAPIIGTMLGSPFAVWGLRLMGCRIGRSVFVDTTLFSEFDLVEIGDFAAVNLGATIQSHLFEDRIMKADKLAIGEGATVGNMAVVLYDTTVGTGAWLGPLSVLMKGERLEPLSRWYGIPTQPLPVRTQWTSKSQPATPPALDMARLPA